MLFYNILTGLNTTRLRYLFLTLAIIPASSGCNLAGVFLGKNNICTCNKVGNFSISPCDEQLSRSSRARRPRVVPIGSSNLYIISWMTNSHRNNLFLTICICTSQYFYSAFALLSSWHSTRNKGSYWSFSIIQTILITIKCVLWTILR